MATASCLPPGRLRLPAMRRGRNQARAHRPSRSRVKGQPLDRCARRPHNVVPVMSWLRRCSSFPWPSTRASCSHRRGELTLCSVRRGLSKGPRSQRRRGATWRPRASPAPARANLTVSSRRQRTPCSSRRPRHASSIGVGPTCMPASSSDPLSDAGYLCARKSNSSSNGTCASQVPLFLGGVPALPIPGIRETNARGRSAPLSADWVS